MNLRKKKKNTRLRLIEQACTVFTQKGYQNATVAEICKLANANIAAINYHFRSKENLYQEVIKYAYEKAERTFPFDKKIDEAASPEKRLRAFISTILHRILTPEPHGNFYKLVAREMADPTEASGTIVRELAMAHRSRLHQIVLSILGEPKSEEVVNLIRYSIFSQCFFLKCNEKGRQHHFKNTHINLADINGLVDHITQFSLAGILSMKSKQSGNCTP